MRCGGRSDRAEWRSLRFQVSRCVVSAQVRLTITILSGTRAGQRFVLASGDSLRIGRTSKADVAVADDPTMSGIHYEVHCTADEATVRDLQSRNGLFINGQPVNDAVLQSDDTIRAGRTHFSVAIDGAVSGSSRTRPDDETRAHDPADATRAIVPKEVAQAAASSWPLPATTLFPIGMPAGRAASEGATLDGSTIGQGLANEKADAADRLYVVVDGATSGALVQEARRGNLRTENLVARDSSPYLSAVAPYLIEISHDAGFADMWQAMRNRNPGILIESRADFEEVLVHLRSIFCRKDDLGRQSFFRFYDPQLLYSWLQSCTSPQLESFFGCLTSVVVGLDAGGRLLRLTHQDGSLGEEEVTAA